MQPFSALLLIQAFPDKRLRKIKEEVLTNDAILKTKLDSRSESQRDVSGNDSIYLIIQYFGAGPDAFSVFDLDQVS